jgi:hypothetical protein
MYDFWVDWGILEKYHTEKCYKKFKLNYKLRNSAGFKREIEAFTIKNRIFNLIYS